MKIKISQYSNEKHGTVLLLVIIALIILTALGLGILTVAFGVRQRAIAMKNETTAMLSAEAGYEEAIFRMSQQPDMLAALDDPDFASTGNLNFEDGHCNYEIQFFTFVGSRPVYRIMSWGYAGAFSRTVDVKVIQAIGGWDMGMCRVPSDTSSTEPVNYASGEIIDIPLHINNLNDSPDNRDIYISGDPAFLQTVAMGESKGNKYPDPILSLFEDGIYFDQPDSKITDELSVQTKVNRFRSNTKAKYKFQPVGNAPVQNPNAAVHLEFFVQNGVGKVRITNNCTVRGFQQSSNSRTWDFEIVPDSGGNSYKRYDIYSYHLMSENADSTGQRKIVNLDDTYVSQSIGGVQSEPGGQIFVDGNVIIGSGEPDLAGIEQDVIKGKLTVVATGNIWIADSITVDDNHDPDGRPSKDNQNVLGLVAQGVVKIIDPGMSDYSYVDDSPVEPSGYDYVPVARVDSGQPVDSHKRHLPDPMIIEAAVTVGGGGWGAENVRRSSYGGRKEQSGIQDNLVLRGTIAEAVRGVVGLVGSDGYIKKYYLDERMLEGILPSDFWLRGKYIPAPAGWADYRL